MLTTSVGGFTSPNYPLPYHANAECYWHIKTSAGSTVELSFGDFHLENSINCNYDYLAVRERRIRHLLHNCRVRYWKVLSLTLSLMWICFTRCMTASAPVLLRWPNCVEMRFLLLSAPPKRTCTWSYVQTASSTQADFWLTTKPVSDQTRKPWKRWIHLVLSKV